MVLWHKLRPKRSYGDTRCEMQRSRKLTKFYTNTKNACCCCGKLSIYHHAKTDEHIVFDMKTPFNGKMALFAAISLPTLIVMSEFVTFYVNNWMKPPKHSKNYKLDKIQLILLIN